MFWIKLNGIAANIVGFSELTRKLVLKLVLVVVLIREY